MRKKYLSALLFGALLFASAGTFTSCKDYDDDISNLQSQIDGLATKDDMQAKLDQMQTAVNDAKATAEEALEKANAAGDADKIAELEGRIADLEEVLGDIDAMKEEIQNALDSQIAEFRTEMEELLAQVEELTGYSLGMVTSVDLQTNEDAGFDTNLDLNYSRIASVTQPDGKKVASYEFGKGLTGAFTVKEGNVYTVKDNILASIAPVDAAVSADMVSLINSNGEDLNQYVTYTSEDYSKLLTSQSRSIANGLREIGVQLKEDVDFEAFHQLVSTAPEYAEGSDGYVNYALAVTDAEKARTVTSTYDLTVKVDVEKSAEDIESASTISSDAHVRGAALAEYPMGEDKPNNDEDCYPAKLGEAFYINVASDLTKGGHVMASYVIVDINNKNLSTTDKAAINSLDFEGVNTVSKDNEFTITISGESSGIVVPLKVVTIDYTGVVEEHTVWVKAGKEVVGMTAEYTVTPEVYVADPLNYVVDAVDEFKVPGNAAKYSVSLTVGEDNHIDQVSYNSDIQNITWGGLNQAGITWLSFWKDAKCTQAAGKASDVAYAKFAGVVNLNSMRDGETYTGVIKFYDKEGTYLSTNEIKVTKVLPTAVPSYFSAKTNAINNGVLTVYPSPKGTPTGNEFNMNKAFNGLDKTTADYFILRSDALKGLAELETVSTIDKITKINSNIINDGKTYEAAMYYNYGKIEYQPVGVGVADIKDYEVKWDTDFAIKFGCVPVDSKYSWTVEEPEVYYKENITIAPVTKYDKDGDPSEYGDFVTVKDPYLQAIDPFRNNGTDWEWNMWSPWLQSSDVTVKLITDGDKVNEFFTPSIVPYQDKYALKLEQTSSAVVLSGDVETTVVFEFTDHFGHKHEISALTFTMKKDHATE